MAAVYMTTGQLLSRTYMSYMCIRIIVDKSRNVQYLVGSQVKGAKCVFHTFEKIEFKCFNRQLKFRKCI